MINLVSIIVPVYNAKEFLRLCLESIVSQSYSDFELILVDDGSEDCSSQICDEFAKKDSRVRVIHKRNEGVSVARNVGLDSATGEWVVFVDSDDLLNENALQNFLDVAEKANSDVVLASANSVDSSLNVKQLKNFGDCDSMAFLPIKHYALWGYMFRRSVLENSKIRFVPGLAYSEDRVFLYNLSKNCKNLSTSSKVVYTYRKNDSSVCSSKNGLRKFEHHVLAAKQLEILKNECSSTELKTLLEREIKHVIDLGMYQFISLPYERDDFVKIKKFYYERFSNKLFFFKCFFKQTLTFKRRTWLKCRK